MRVFTIADIATYPPSNQERWRASNPVAPPPPQKLLTACWCGSKTRKIPVADVRAGITFSHGPRCKPRTP